VYAQARRAREANRLTPGGQRETNLVAFLLVLAVLLWTLFLVLAVLGRLLRAPDRDVRVIVRPLPWPRIEIAVEAVRGRPGDGSGTNGRNPGDHRAYGVHNRADREISTA